MGSPFLLFSTAKKEKEGGARFAQRLVQTATTGKQEPRAGVSKRSRILRRPVESAVVVSIIQNMVTKMIRYALILAAAVMPAVAALAGGEGRAGESPRPESFSPNWSGLMFTVLFLLCIALVGFKSAKRTHLD